MFKVGRKNSWHLLMTVSNNITTSLNNEYVDFIGISLEDATVIINSRGLYIQEV